MHGCTKEQMLRDCESHLYFLWDARRLFPQQQDRYKQIAAELRVLVCEFGSNRPLLLNLMDKYGFSYDVHPPGHPFDRQPIPMVGWRDDPAYQQLAGEVAATMGDEEKLGELLEKQASLRHPVPFREFVNCGLAVHIAPHDYSYRDLTRAVAEQIGSSHEDEAVDESIVRLRNILIGGIESHIAPLIGFADLVIKVGSMFLGYLVENYGYKPRYFKAI